jgi:hypothetical protein
MPRTHFKTLTKAKFWIFERDVGKFEKKPGGVLLSTLRTLFQICRCRSQKAEIAAGRVLK